MKDLGSGVLFGDPYWLICDEGMGLYGQSKRCYDSDFSYDDDWKAGCKPDTRISEVYEHPNTYVWYVCP